MFVSGQDAELGAMKRIVAGTQSMTVYKPLRPLARMAAGAAMNMAQGQTEDGVVTINNGKKDVPARLLEPISVDKETMDRTVIADGYHKRDEVYAKSGSQPGQRSSIEHRPGHAAHPRRRHADGRVRPDARGCPGAHGHARGPAARSGHARDRAR